MKSFRYGNFLIVRSYLIMIKFEGGFFWVDKVGVKLEDFCDLGKGREGYFRLIIDSMWRLFRVCVMRVEIFIVYS